MDEERFSGRELGGYRLLHLIGAGGAGLVYLAQRVDEPAALFAVKLVDISAQPDLTLRSALQLRFKREAEALARLQHPHILPLVSFGEDGDLLYMALPFMSGGTLATRIGAFPRGMPLDDVAAYLAPLADALDYAHGQGVIHRDIKPSNVLLDGHGLAHLADFGIARLFSPADLAVSPTSAPATLTATGQALGTPQYMAPEQISGGKVGPATDVYALGVVLYQMVTGSLPFHAETPLALAMQHLSDPPPPLRPQRADLPAAAEAAILRALAKRPEERYPTAGALVAAFSAGLRAPTPAATVTPVTVTTATPTPTLLATPLTPASGLSGPYGAPRYSEMTLPVQAVRRMRMSAGWAIAAAITLLAVALTGIGVVGIPALSRGAGASVGGGGGQQATSAPSLTPTTSAPTQWARAVIPAGPLIYETHAAGSCDQQGASWASNGMATQSCQSNALIMSAQECNCAIGVATLSSIPAASYPSSYVAQVRIDILGGASTAKFGFKFRQQSVQDTGNGRGGFSFLVDPNGQWQFNRYDANGTRRILTQEQLPSGLRGAHTLDLVVSGASYTFYLDGRMIDQEQDSTYLSGFFCLAIEPGATIAFRDLALFSTT